MSPKFKNRIVAGSELQNSVNEVYAQAESEGVPKDIIRGIIWNKIIAAGFSDRTARKYLPDPLKRSGGYNERKR